MAAADGAASRSRSLPALSFLDLAWVRLGVDPLEAASAWSTATASHRGGRRAGPAARRPLPQPARCCPTSSWRSSDAPAEPVTVLQRLGLPDEAIVEVAWADLDRAFEPDHLTSL